jgi:phenylacetic acid degradation operon negative regulatory protein
MASALLGETPPTLSVRRLVRVAGLFAINDNQARVALSRMVARGEVATDGSGNYTLQGPLLGRAHRQAVSRKGSTGEFDGQFHLVVVTQSGDAAHVRQRRRAALRLARLGEIRDGVWLRPANLGIELDADTQRSVSVFSAAPDEDPASLCRSAFDLEGWSRRATQLVREMDRAELDGASLAAGFSLDAAVLRHLQRDPLIPASLLSPGWPGGALRTRYERFDAAFRSALAAAHRSFAGHDAAPTA